MNKSTRKISGEQEKRIAKSLGAKRTPNSGAGMFSKSDLYIGSEWAIEAKTCMEPKKSFSIRKEWLEKLKEEQYACKKEHCALCFDFGDKKQRYYIIDENTFKFLNNF